MKDYQKAIIVNKPVEEVYMAITAHISEWWSNDLQGAATNVGDSFDIAFGDTRKTFRIAEMIPDKRIVWTCEKAYIDSPALKNKSEWVGTTLIWTLSADDRDRTTLGFLHAGLNKIFECYHICEDGWDYFLSSLESYLKTGKGRPYLKPMGLAPTSY
jgi:uncharacterized protein YndB with AHSA1/START domain